MMTKKFSEWNKPTGDFLKSFYLNGDLGQARDLEEAVFELVGDKETIPYLVNGKFPDRVKHFECKSNSLTSLKGAPRIIEDGFYCSRNQLKDLKGGPEKVGWDFICRQNELTSLVGAPLSVGGIFSCYRNKLTDLKGAPRKVRFNFNCMYNPLTSLEGAPEKIGGAFRWDEFRIDSGKWGDEGLMEKFCEPGLSEQAKKLILTGVTEKGLDEWFKKRPVDLHLLDFSPEIKEGVLRRTGMKDLSRLGRNLKSGLI